MFSTDNNNNTKQYWEPNQHIIISVGSRDRLKTGEIAAENFSFDRINYILKYILKQKTVICRYLQLFHSITVFSGFFNPEKNAALKSYQWQRFE